MITPETFWRRLVRAALPPAPAPAPVEEPPRWFARRVVAVWQSSLASGGDLVWEQVTRRGLAVTLGIMALSLLLLARPFQPAPTWESLASESVLSAVLPP